MPYDYVIQEAFAHARQSGTTDVDDAGYRLLYSKSTKRFQQHIWEPFHFSCLWTLRSTTLKNQLLQVLVLLWVSVPYRLCTCC